MTPLVGKHLNVKDVNKGYSMFGTLVDYERTPYRSK